MQSLFQINHQFLAVKSFFTETFKLLVPTVSIQRGKVNQGNKSSNLGCDSAMLKLQRTGAASGSLLSIEPPADSL